MFPTTEMHRNKKILQIKQRNQKVDICIAILLYTLQQYWNIILKTEIRMYDDSAFQVYTQTMTPSLLLSHSIRPFFYNQDLYVTFMLRETFRKLLQAVICMFLHI